MRPSCSLHRKFDAMGYKSSRRFSFPHFPPSPPPRNSPSDRRLLGPPPPPPPLSLNSERPRASSLSSAPSLISDFPDLLLRKPSAADPLFRRHRRLLRRPIGP